MKKLIFIIIILMLVSVSCGDDKNEPGKESGEGENCTRMSDCRTGLVCIDSVCVDPDEKTDDVIIVDNENNVDDETVEDDFLDVPDDEDDVEVDLESGDMEEFSDNDVDSNDPEDDSYPEETATSNKIGDVACNMSFYDDLNTEHKLEEWYYKNNSEGKLVWLIFAAYDCMFSKSLKNSLPSIISQDVIDKGLRVILIMNGNLMGPNPGSEPLDLVNMKETMIQVDSINSEYTYGYLKSDQQGSFYKFMNDGYPVSVFIDTSDMKIVNHFEGWDSSYAANTESFIVGFLK